MAHKPSKTYTDDGWYCGICDKDTKQEIHESGHERDSSGDWQRCLECGAYYSGYSGKWEPKEEIMWDEREEGMPEDTDNAIRGFFGDNRWLSNFWECPVMFRGLTFGSSEAAYQAAKSLSPLDWARFSGMKPGESKKEGRKVKIRGDWDTIKVQMMYDICLDKFLRNKDLREKLIATGDKHLEETNHWGDDYWGVYKGKGQNQLGKVLMQVREKMNTPAAKMLT